MALVGAMTLARRSASLSAVGRLATGSRLPAPDPGCFLILSRAKRMQATGSLLNPTRGSRTMDGPQLSWYLALSAILFTIGVVGVIIKRNVIAMFMCIELMLNAVNLTFVAFSSLLSRRYRSIVRLHRDDRRRRRGRRRPWDYHCHLPQSGITRCGRSQCSKTLSFVLCSLFFAR